MAADPAIVLSFEDARHIVEEHARRVHPLHSERVPLLEGVGRVLSSAIFADRDFPPFPRAARDGYALRADEVKNIPAKLTVIGEIKAGASAADIPKRVGRGEAVAIMTGAPAPPGADAVIMVEHTRRNGSSVEVLRAITSGDNIVPQGSEARCGDLLVDAGSRIDEATIAVAASIGKSVIDVFRKPRVAVLATGDEIVDIEAQPGPTEIRNSNTYSLAAQVLAAGAEPVCLPIAPDKLAPLRELVQRGLESDLLLLAGGVSMGEYDLVEKVLGELGAEFFFTGAQIQPGRPIVFGRIQKKYFFGLPGNPVSTMVTFELFARPVIQALMGSKPKPLVFLHARLKAELKTKAGLKRFLPAVVSGEFEGAEVELAGWHGSGDIASVARSNCYVVIPPDRERIAPGEWVPVLLRPARM